MNAKRVVALAGLLLLLSACGASPTAVTSPSPTAVTTPTTAKSPSPSACPTVAGPWPRWVNLAYDSTRAQIVLFGGYGGTVTNDTWVWDGRSWQQRTPAANPPARQGAALTDDPDHHVVLLFGGDSMGNPRGDTWTWNGSNWTQMSPAHSPSPRTGAALTYDPVRHVAVLFGGSSAGDTWTWDGTDWTRQSPAASPSARMNARIAFDAARGNVVLVGGAGGLDDTWTWDGVNWTEQSPSNSPPEGFTMGGEPAQMAYDPIRAVVVLVAAVWHSSSSSDNTMETVTWNGTTWTRLSPATSPPLRNGFGLVFDAARGLVVLAGGKAWSGGPDPTSTWGWNGTDWSVIGCSPVPPPTASPSARPTASPSQTAAGPWPRWVNLAYDSTRAQIVLFGGYGGTVTNDTWIWDGRSWQQRTPAANPPARQGAALTDDPDRHVVLLFGGDSIGSMRGDTWTWNGSNWTRMSPAHSPSPRTGAALTYDPVRHVAVLFGGSSAGDTWTWDGTDWTRQSPTASPSARMNARIAFDAARGNVVLFGGAGGLDDTWTWDGVNWTEQSPSNSPPGVVTMGGQPAQMAYDPIRAVVVLVAVVRHSSSSSDNTMDTWTWNGTTWTRLSPTTSPPLRDGFGLVFDAARGLVVLAGGKAWSGGPDPTSTWGWNGTDWSQIG